MKVSTVYVCPERLAPVSSSVNPSLCFISSSHCLLATGDSSTLYLLHTPSRTICGDIASESEVSWKLVEELKLFETDGEPLSILSAHYSESEHQLNMATMVLHSTPTHSHKGKEKEAATRPPTATYNWHQCDMDLSSLSSPPKQSGSSKKETKIDLVCSLQSTTVALYSVFASGHLVILSEADVVSASQPPPTEDEKGTDEEKERPDPEQLVAEVLERERDESKTFAGLGFGKESSDESQYQWTQTEGDITITFPLPEDVMKSDIRCTIDRQDLVVGLSDGTTFFRGRLFAPVASDCSTWTIDNHK